MLCFDRHIGMLPHDKMLCPAALIPQARTRSSLPPTRQIIAAIRSESFHTNANQAKEGKLAEGL